MDLSSVEEALEEAWREKEVELKGQPNTHQEPFPMAVPTGLALLCGGSYVVKKLTAH